MPEEVLPKIQERISQIETRQKLHKQEFDLVIAQIRSSMDNMDKSLAGHVAKAEDTMNQVGESMKSYYNLFNNMLEDRRRERDEKEIKLLKELGDLKTEVESFKLLKKIVYGAVAIVLTTVLSSILYLIIV